MTLYFIAILALVQGITEFLPISSSGHLVLVHRLGGLQETWSDEILLDVAVHVGTLLSVLLYFHKDVLNMLCGLLDLLKGKVNSAKAKLDLMIILSSFPVIIAGFIIHEIEPSV